MIIIVMGVVGAGKTTIGRLLARVLGWQFADADDFHSRSNIEKIRAGVALTDADREPWLQKIREVVIGWEAQGMNAVLACSALKREYRERIMIGSDTRLIYLRGSYELIRERLQERHGHFATEQLLDSQFAILEEPEDAVVIDVSGTPEQIVGEIRDRLGLG